MMLNYKVISVSCVQGPKFSKIEINFDTILAEGRGSRLRDLVLCKVGGEVGALCKSLYDVFCEDVTGKSIDNVAMPYVFSALVAMRLDFSTKLCQDLYSCMKSTSLDEMTRVISAGAAGDMNAFQNAEGEVWNFLRKQFDLDSLTVRVLQEKLGFILTSIKDTSTVIESLKYMSSALSEIEKIVPQELSHSIPELKNSVFIMAYTEFIAWMLTCDETDHSDRRSHIEANYTLYNSMFIPRLLTGLDKLYGQIRPTFKERIVQSLRDHVVKLVSDSKSGTYVSSGRSYKDIAGGDLVVLRINREVFESNSYLACWRLFQSIGHQESMGTRRGENPNHVLLSMEALKSLTSADAAVIFFSNKVPGAINYTTLKGHYADDKYVFSIGQQIVDSELQGNGLATIMAVTGINWMFENCHDAPKTVRPTMRLNFKTAHPATIKQAMRFYAPSEPTIPGSADSVGRMVQSLLDGLPEENKTLLEQKSLIYVKDRVCVLRLLPFLYNDIPHNGLESAMDCINGITLAVELVFYHSDKLDFSLLKEGAYQIGSGPSLKFTREELDEISFVSFVGRDPIVDVAKLQEPLKGYEDGGDVTPEQRLLAYLHKRLEESRAAKANMERLETIISSTEEPKWPDFDTSDSSKSALLDYLGILKVAPFVKGNKVKVFPSGYVLVEDIQSRFPDPGSPKLGPSQTSGALFKDMSMGRGLGADTFILSHEFNSRPIINAARMFKAVSDVLDGLSEVCNGKDTELKATLLETYSYVFGLIDQEANSSVFPPSLLKPPLEAAIKTSEKTLVELEIELRASSLTRLKAASKGFDPEQIAALTSDRFIESINVLEESRIVLSCMKGLLTAFDSITEESVLSEIRPKNIYLQNGVLTQTCMAYALRTCTEHFKGLLSSKDTIYATAVIQTRLTQSVDYFLNLEQPVSLAKGKQGMGARRCQSLGDLQHSDRIAEV